jgi:lipopolysaccharide export system protein LptA
MTARRIGLALAAALLAVSSARSASAQASGGDIFSGFQANSKDPVQVDAKTLEIYGENKQRISVFSGNVVVTRGSTIMKAIKMKLYSATGGKSIADKAAKGAKSSAFTRIEATGPVHLTSGDQAVSGDNAVVDMKTQLLTLTGKVVLVRGKDVASGHRLVVDLRTGKATFAEAPGIPVHVYIDPRAANGAGEGGAAGKASPAR